MTYISRYEDLVFAVGEYLDRDDLVDLMPRFVGLAELRMNRDLRVNGQVTSTSLTPSSGVITLPTDFGEARAMYQANHAPLRAMSEEEVADFQASGTPAGFVVRGATAVLVPSSDTAVTLVYYKRIVALTAASPTNWLLTAAPDLYLWSVCSEAATYVKDAEKGGIANERYSAAVLSYVADDQAYRWSRARVMPEGVNP